MFARIGQFQIRDLQRKFEDVAAISTRRVVWEICNRISTHSRIQVLGPNSTRPRCLAFLNKGTPRLLFLLSMFRPSYLIQQITHEHWKFFAYVLVPCVRT
jgi:membrane-bound metal-dependent hydrolase YbcI (DUF457 family)